MAEREPPAYVAEREAPAYVAIVTDGNGAGQRPAVSRSERGIVPARNCACSPFLGGEEAYAVATGAAGNGG